MQLTSTCIFTSPLFPKKKKRTNQIKPTEQIPLQPPLKLLQFHFSLHKFQNRYIDIQIKKSSNPSKDCFPRVITEVRDNNLVSIRCASEAILHWLGDDSNTESGVNSHAV